MNELVKCLVGSLQGLEFDQMRDILDNVNEILLDIQFSTDSVLACQVTRDLIRSEIYKGGDR